jgi:predicted flap endonuclease-1-like 5' DNA nuclease
MDGMAKVEEIEGVGSVYATKLSAAGARSVEDLLRLGATRTGREKLAEAVHLKESLILKWVNRADLMRLKGVGSEYSDLLEAAGVDSPVELSQRVAAHLCFGLAEINTTKKLVRRSPTLSEVEHWIAEAKDLPPVVMH